jgi:hypothetical protein
MRRLPALVTLALLGIAGTAGAQSKVGTTMGQFLGIEPSARTAAMGNAGVALVDGIEGVYFNPGAIGILDRPTAFFTHAAWYVDISYNYAAGSVPLGRWGVLFASVTSLNSGDIDVRTVDQPLGTGERYDVGNTAIGLGFGRRVTSRFTAGVQINFVEERIWRTAQRTFTFSVGTIYQFPTSRIRLGAGMTNVGTNASFSGKDLAFQYDADPDVYGDNSALPAEQYTGSFPVPIMFRVGISYPWELGRSRVILALDALHPADNTESLNLGGEWMWRELFALRAGYQTLFQEDTELGLTLGFGLRGDIGDTEYRFDYAWAGHERLDETQRFTFGLVF